MGLESQYLSTQEGQQLKREQLIGHRTIVEMIKEYADEYEGAKYYFFRHGFIKYKTYENECEITEVFLAKSLRGEPHRKEAILSVFIDEIKKLGIDTLYGRFNKQYARVERSYRLAIKNGFVPFAEDENLIWYIKRI